MQASCFYPTTTKHDLAAGDMMDVKGLLSKPLPEIYQTCYNLVANLKKKELAVILRALMESPITPDSVSLVGWFAINNLIPIPTLYVYLKTLLDMRNTYYGEQCCIAFAQEVILYGYKYTDFLEKVALIPGFCYRKPDLYIAINQTLETTVQIDAYMSRNHFSIPEKTRKFVIPQNPHLNLLPISKSQVEPPMKQTLEECVQASYLMPDDNRRHYLISFVLNSPIPDTLKDCPNVLLEAVCVYANHLLSNVISEKVGIWERYSFHPQLHQIGIWIGLLSVSHGAPPPVYFIDFHRLLRESIKLGCFHEVVILLTGFFSRASSVYQLPCPYTAGLFEIMAGFVNHPGVRLDIIQSVETLASMMRTNISYFFNRTVEVDPLSPEMHAVFQLSKETGTFYLAPYTRDAILSVDQQRVYNFFNFNPRIDTLPPFLRKVDEMSEYIRKYYFVGHGSAVTIPKTKLPRSKLIEYTMSMALSNNPILANTASRILYKLLLPQKEIDNNKLRYAFPNHDIFLAFFRANCLNPHEINSVLCDILTNPEIGPIALPLIQRMMPHIHKLARANPSANFTSLYVLSRMQPPQGDYRLPPIEHSHTPLLRFFINYCKSGTAEAKQEFISHFTPGTPQQVTALIQLVIASVNENSDDYTAIDCYATIIPSLPSKVLNEALISGFIKAMEMFTPTMVVAHQSAIFRVAYESFSALDDLNPAKLIPFFIRYSPGTIPEFAACWIQLVLHPNVFPTLVESADQYCNSFCLRFLITIIKLAVNMPDGFYRPVIRILYTICDQFPLFITSYHCLLLEHVPPRFTQIRNIILCADPHGDPVLPPPVGVISGDSQDMKLLKMKAEPFIKDISVQSSSLNLKTITELIKKMVISDGSVVWKFVYFCINAWTQTHEQFTPKNTIIDLFLSLVNTSPIFISALFDHVRYSNSHTRFVMELLLAVFGRLPDNLRESFLIEIFRRMLCVTQPPNTLKELLKRLMNERQSEIKILASKRNEMSELSQIFSVIKMFK